MKSLSVVVVVFVMLLVIALTVYYLYPELSKSGKKKEVKKKSFAGSLGGSCSVKHGCGGNGIDVNDPAFNVKEAIINTLLLQEHLSDNDKFCKFCIAKHFLLNIGIFEESLSLSCNNREKYPMLEESLELMRNLFNKWYNNIDNKDIQLQVLTELREWRREIMVLYYPKLQG